MALERLTITASSSGASEAYLKRGREEVRGMRRGERVKEGVGVMDGMRKERGG
jgi:hypothetical protein